MKLFGLFKNANDPGSKDPKNHLPANLRDDTLKFKTIIENIEDGVVLIDDQQVIRLINPGASVICGWSADEATGISAQAVLQLVNDKGQPYDNNPFAQIFSTGQNLRVNDAYVLTHTKKQVPINLSLSPLTNENKQVTAAVAVFRDVSKERAEEQQRIDFISTASHEMRTPVAAIEGYLALALNDKVATVDKRARDFLEKAQSSTHHLGALFQDLLTSAKAEDGRLTSHPTTIELGDFLEQLTGELRLVAEQKDLVVEFVVGAHDANHAQGGERTIKPLYYVRVDPDRLREVVTNLFDNAVKYTSEGKISIGLTGDNKTVQCFVRDTGAGIPPDDVPHLFQKFYRVDTSATRTVSGTGLGLFICRKIIELYNGRIWAESELGKGSTFYINLPRLSTDEADGSKTVRPNAGT